MSQEVKPIRPIAHDPTKYDVYAWNLPKLTTHFANQAELFIKIRRMPGAKGITLKSLEEEFKIVGSQLGGLEMDFSGFLVGEFKDLLAGERRDLTRFFGHNKLLNDSEVKTLFTRVARRLWDYIQELKNAERIDDTEAQIRILSSLPREQIDEAA